jgi:4-carboxymuconolactone decarboxylase
MPGPDRAAATRIPPLGPDERSERQQEVIDWAVTGPTVNIYLTLARHPDLAERMLRVGRDLRSGQLSLRHREILILRTGWNCGSQYERFQHHRVARAGGMTDEDLERIRLGPDAEGWDPAEAALCRAADELHTDAVVSNPTWAALAAAHDEKSLIEIVMLVGYYHTVCFLLNSLGVPLEGGGGSAEAS